MELTREQALKLHRQMWSDMQDALGDNPDPNNRFIFKCNWIKDNGYINTYGVSDVLDDCFLCEYAFNEKVKRKDNTRCFYCPIDWSELTSPLSINHGFCIYSKSELGYELWQTAPISKILALPERVE